MMMNYLLLWCVTALLPEPATGTVRDIDGNIYHTVTIGDQVWLQENLVVTHYANGDPIPHITNDSAWTAATEGAFCYYRNDTTDAAVNGLLYNAFVLADSRGIAPPGYRVATNEDWQQLCAYMGADTSTRQPGTTLEVKPPQPYDGTPMVFYLMGEESPFKGIKVGLRMADSRFGGRDYQCYWWSASTYSSNSAYAVMHSNMYVGTWFYPITVLKTVGLPIRCIKE